MYLPANNGTVYDLTLLNKVTDSNGNIVQSYEPQVHNQITDLSPSTWQNLHSGMEMAIGEHDQFTICRYLWLVRQVRRRKMKNVRTMRCLLAMHRQILRRLRLQHELHTDMDQAMPVYL